MLVRLGNLLFHTRNALIPLSLLAFILLFSPRPLGDGPGDVLLWLGLALLAVGQGVRILTIGLDYIRRGGKNKRIYADDLVTTGIYAHCRNPMYLGNILIVLGYLAVYGNLAMIAIAGMLYLIAYIAIMKAEEEYLSSHFGAPYERYQQEVPRWIPRLGGLGATLSQFDFDWEKVLRKEYGTIYMTIIVTIALLARKAHRAGTVDWAAFGLAAGIVTLAYLAVRFWKKTIRQRLIRREAQEAVAMQQDPLGARRAQIDAVDQQLVALLSERGRLVLEMFAEKDRRGLPRFDPARTRAILDEAVKDNPGPLSEAQLRELMGMILGWYLKGIAPESESSSAGRTTTVAVAGVENGGR